MMPLLTSNNLNRSATKVSYDKYIFIAANLIAIVLKIIISHRGSTYDFSSYLIVSDLVLDGKNVYSETSRYNYGPIWFSILGLLRAAWKEPLVFHNSIVILLSAIDFAISYIFYKKVSLFSSVLWALNPISLIVSGYYLQFDNLAILVALLAILNEEKNLRENSAAGHFRTGILIAISLAIKHVLIFLPACLLLRRIKNRADISRGIVLTILAYGLFLGSFLPFLNSDNANLILKNVFFYQSVNNLGLMRGLVENWMKISGSLPILYGSVLFLGTSILAYFNPNCSIVRFFALHLATVFCLLPGMAPQYLIYFVPLLLIDPKNIYTNLALVLAAFLLVSISPGLQVEWIDHRFFRLAMIQLLIVASLASMALSSENKTSRSK